MKDKKILMRACSKIKLERYRKRNFLSLSFVDSANLFATVNFDVKASASNATLQNVITENFSQRKTTLKANI